MSATHGTQSGYRSGCRCDDCKAAKRTADAAQYRRNREQRIAYQRAYREQFPEKVKERKRRYRIENPEKVSEKDRRYRLANEEALREKARARYRAKRDEMLAYARQYRLANREKVDAQHRLQYAVKRGVLQRPETCETCGGGGRIHAHHEDYSKPLEVAWLCQSCHYILHARGYREAVDIGGRT